MIEELFSTESVYQLTALMLLASALIVMLVYVLRPVFIVLLNCFEFFCDMVAWIRK